MRVGALTLSLVSNSTWKSDLTHCPGRTVELALVVRVVGEPALSDEHGKDGSATHLSCREIEEEENPFYTQALAPMSGRRTFPRVMRALSVVAL